MSTIIKKAVQTNPDNSKEPHNVLILEKLHGRRIAKKLEIILQPNFKMLLRVYSWNTAIT